MTPGGRGGAIHHDDDRLLQVRNQAFVGDARQRVVRMVRTFSALETEWRGAAVPIDAQDH
jgi:hypothetical protein